MVHISTTSLVDVVYYGAFHLEHRLSLLRDVIKTVCSPPPQTERPTGGVCPCRPGPAPPRGALLLSLGRGRPHAHSEWVLQRRHAFWRDHRELQTAQLSVGAGAQRFAPPGCWRTQVHPLHVPGPHGHQTQWVFRSSVTNSCQENSPVNVTGPSSAFSQATSLSQGSRCPAVTTVMKRTDWPPVWSTKSVSCCCSTCEVAYLFFPLSGNQC